LSLSGAGRSVKRVMHQDRLVAVGPVETIAIGTPVSV
jgi:hypothetical protein